MSMPPPPPPSTFQPTTPAEAPYPARLEIDYPERSSRLTMAFRIILIIPIAIILGILTSGGASFWSNSNTYGNESDAFDSGAAYTFESDSTDWVASTGGGIVGALFLVTLLMILFRQLYPRWWFDFALELNRFSARVTAYFALLTDEYPSTVEQQRVHLELDYPDVERDLNRWLPLVKWLLAITHFIILFFLWIGVFFAVIVAWFAILLTGRYPRRLFGFVVGVGRWSLRVWAYSILLITDRYPPFALD